MIVHFYVANMNSCSYNIIEENDYVYKRQSDRADAGHIKNSG